MISLVEVTLENFPSFQADIMGIERTSFPSPWSLNTFIDEINSPISYLWTLITDGEVAGYICFWMFANEIHLMNIAVHRNRRGKGLGRYLLAKMIEVGVSKEVDTAWLEVRPSNLIAKALYQEMGFQQIACRPGYYRDTREDAIVMSLSLSQNLSIRR